MYPIHFACKYSILEDYNTLVYYIGCTICIACSCYNGLQETLYSETWGGRSNLHGRPTGQPHPPFWCSQKDSKRRNFGTFQQLARLFHSVCTYANTYLFILGRKNVDICLYRWSSWRRGRTVDQAYSCCVLMHESHKRKTWTCRPTPWVNPCD